MKPDAFLARFLLPLVEGGAIHVGAPLGAPGLEKLLATKPDAALAARIDDARLRVAGAFLLEPIPPRLDAASLRLAVALHDLLFLQHPSAAGWTVRDKRLHAVTENAAALARLPGTIDADDLVARHTLLHAFPSLGRTDVRVTFWAGKQEFHGTEPPRRLKAWPSVRRVREERWRASCFAEAAAHPLGAAVVRALLDGSPLTDLLHPIRIEPKLALGRAAEVLVSPEVCRLVAYQLLELGFDRVGGPLALATLVELDALGPTRARFVLAFLSHLHLCQLFGPPPRDRRGAIARTVAGGDAALRDFYALYAALWRTAPELALPADARRDRRVTALAGDHAAACEAACGTTRVAELCLLVARAAHPSLPALAPPQFPLDGSPL